MFSVQSLASNAPFHVNRAVYVSRERGAWTSVMLASPSPSEAHLGSLSCSGLLTTSPMCSLPGLTWFHLARLDLLLHAGVWGLPSTVTVPRLMFVPTEQRDEQKLLCVWSSQGKKDEVPALRGEVGIISHPYSETISLLVKKNLVFPNGVSMSI